MIIWNGDKTHKSLTFLKAIQYLIDVGGIPVNEVGTAIFFTDTVVVEIRFQLGRLVGG